MTKNNSLQYWHELCARMLAEVDSLPLGEQRESFRHSLACVIKKAGIDDTEFVVYGVEALEQLRKARHSLILSGAEMTDYRQIDANIHLLEPMVSLQEAYDRRGQRLESIYFTITVVELVTIILLAAVAFLIHRFA